MPLSAITRDTSPRLTPRNPGPSYSRPRYNNPTLTAIDFLLNVMHDPTIPLHNRVDAAVEIIKILPPDMYASMFPSEFEREPFPGEERIVINILGLPPGDGSERPQ
jgi:hypothetical protein